MSASKCLFFSRLNRPKTIFSDLGNGKTPVFEIRVVDGVESLVQIGEDDTFAFIQAGLEDTLIYNILDRYKYGEVDVIARRQGFYADVVGMPKTLSEAQNLLKNISNNFDKLPDQVKSKVGGDVNEFILQVASGTVESVKDLLFGGVLEKDSQKIEKEVNKGGEE